MARELQPGEGSSASVSRLHHFRIYAFTQVGDLPLVLNVAFSTSEIEAAWRARALVIGSVVLTLCGLTAALSLLFGRELRRRTAMQAELARLSRTDVLTGQPTTQSRPSAYPDPPLTSMPFRRGAHGLRGTVAGETDGHGSSLSPRTALTGRRRG